MKLKSLITNISKLKDYIPFRKKKFDPVVNDFNLDSSNQGTEAYAKRQTKINGGFFKKISWEELIKKSFSPYTRPLIQKVFIISLVVSATYGIGKTTGLILDTFLTPDIGQIKTNDNIVVVRDFDNIRKQAASIRSANLFNAQEKNLLSDKPKKITNTICTEATRKSSLPIQLKSTIVLQNSKKSLASLNVKSSKDLNDFREGDSVNDMARIGRIVENKIIFRNLQNNECEYIANQEKEVRTSTNPIKFVSAQEGSKLLNKNDRIKQEGNKYIIKKSFRDEMLNDMTEVLTQARAIQLKNPDGTMSFKITEIVPGSIYSQLNIQDGDVITTINGKKIQNLNEVMTLFGNIKDIDQLSLGVKRNDVEEEMDYQFD